MSGVPLTIHIRVFIGHFIIFILLIEQKEIVSPNGSASKSVRANILNVVAKPSRRLSVTVVNKDIFLVPIKNIVSIPIKKADENLPFYIRGFYKLECKVKTVLFCKLIKCSVSLKLFNSFVNFCSKA